MKLLHIYVFLTITIATEAMINITDSALIVTCDTCLATVTTYQGTYVNYEGVIHTIDTLHVPLADFQHAHVAIDQQEPILYARRPYKETEPETCYGIDFDCFFFQNNFMSIISWCALAIIVAGNIYIATNIFMLSKNIFEL